MDGKLEILTGLGVDGLGNPGRMGGSEHKNSSSGVFFIFKLDWYILTTWKKNFAMESLVVFQFIVFLPHIL